jgi:hypothetical protein
MICSAEDCFEGIECLAIHKERHSLPAGVHKSLSADLCRVHMHGSFMESSKSLVVVFTVVFGNVCFQSKVLEIRVEFYRSPVSAQATAETVRSHCACNVWLDVL